MSNGSGSMLGYGFDDYGNYPYGSPWLPVEVPEEDLSPQVIIIEEEVLARGGKSEAR